MGSVQTAVVGRRYLWAACALSLVGLVLSITAIALRTSERSRNQPSFDYGVVLDAGSSHTNLFVYTWTHHVTPGTERITAAPALSQHKWTCKSKVAGISSFASPADAAASIAPLLACAQGYIPSPSHSTTPVFLGATAGMRLLYLSNSTLGDAIMVAVCGALSASPFAYSQGSCRVLSGAEEGLYGWITANYLLGNYGEPPLATPHPGASRSLVSRALALASSVLGAVASPAPNIRGIRGIRAADAGGVGISPMESACLGALDLGGASTQITFVPLDVSVVTDGDRQDVTLFNNGYDVYAHSYLGLGLDQARDAFEAAIVTGAGNSTTVADPCLPVGYNRTMTSAFNDSPVTLFGVGNPADCSARVSALIRKDECTCTSCGIGGACQPPPRGLYFAFAGYAFAAAYLNVSSYSFVGPSQLDARSDVLCALPWEQWVKTAGVSSFVTANSCFSAKYAYALLVRGYGFAANDNTVRFSTTAAGSDMGWALGYMLDETGVLPVFAQPKPSPLISTGGFAALLSLGLVTLASGVGVGVYLWRLSGSGADHEYDPINSSEGWVDWRQSHLMVTVVLTSVIGTLIIRNVIISGSFLGEKRE